jgi:hypothetical protein
MATNTIPRCKQTMILPTYNLLQRPKQMTVCPILPK